VAWIALATPTAGAFSPKGLIAGPPVEALPLQQQAPGLLASGALLLEAELPEHSLGAPCEILSAEILTPWPVSLTVSATHDGHVTLRISGPDRDCVAHVHAARSHGSVRIAFCWNSPRKRAQLSIYCPFTGDFAAKVIDAPLPWPMALVQQIARLGENQNLPRRLAGVAIASHFIPNGPLPGISPDARVETTTGAERLKSVQLGATLRAADAASLTQNVSISPVIGTAQMVLPTFGRLRPFVVNDRHARGAAPLVASAETLVLKSGPEVDYLTGEDCVFVPTEALSSSQIRAIPAPPALMNYAQLICAEPIAARFGDAGLSTLYFSEAAQDLGHRRLTVATDVPGYLRGHVDLGARVLLPHEAHSLGAMRVA